MERPLSINLPLEMISASGDDSFLASCTALLYDANKTLAHGAHMHGAKEPICLGAQLPWGQCSMGPIFYWAHVPWDPCSMEPI